MNCDDIPFLPLRQDTTQPGSYLEATQRSASHQKALRSLRNNGPRTETASSLPSSSAQVGFPDVEAEPVGVLFGRGNPSPNPLGLCTA